MSYSAFYRSHADFLANKPHTTSGDIPADALAAAQKAVEAIVSSGAVSRQSTHQHAIAIYGHSNPDHEFTPGSADDSLSVTVTQIPLDYWKPAVVATIPDENSAGEPAVVGESEVATGESTESTTEVADPAAE